MHVCARSLPTRLRPRSSPDLHPPLPLSQIHPPAPAKFTPLPPGKIHLLLRKGQLINEVFGSFDIKGESRVETFTSIGAKVHLFHYSVSTTSLQTGPLRRPRLSSVFILVERLDSGPPSSPRTTVSSFHFRVVWRNGILTRTSFRTRVGITLHF